MKNQGLSLYEVNREDFMELLKYKVRLENQRYWENRQKYFSVIGEFLNGMTTGKDFIDEFLYLWRKDRDEEVSKINFERNTIPEEFSRLIGKVFMRCEIFEPESTEEEEYNEKWLRNSIKEIFSKMQKYLDK